MENRVFSRNTVTIKTDIDAQTGWCRIDVTTTESNDTFTYETDIYTLQNGILPCIDRFNGRGCELILQLNQQFQLTTMKRLIQKASWIKRPRLYLLKVKLVTMISLLSALRRINRRIAIIIANHDPFPHTARQYHEWSYGLYIDDIMSGKLNPVSDDWFFLKGNPIFDDCYHDFIGDQFERLHSEKSPEEAKRFMQYMRTFETHCQAKLRQLA